MAKYLDKTPDEWELLTEKWHEDETITCSLQEYLGLNDIEYRKFVFGIDDKDVSDTDVIEKSSEIIRDVVTELVIKPKIEELAKYLADVIDDVRLGRGF